MISLYKLVEHISMTKSMVLSSTGIHSTVGCVYCAGVLWSMCLKRRAVIQSDCCSRWNWHTGSTWTSIAQIIQSCELAVSKNLQHKISFIVWTVAIIFRRN